MNDDKHAFSRYQVDGVRLSNNRARRGVAVRRGVAADLAYVEVLMSATDFEAPLPTVVMLHGRGDGPHVPEGPFGRVSSAMRLVLPQAPVPLGSGYSWLSVSITDKDPDALARALILRTHHLAAFLHAINKSMPTVGKPIVGGFSQGAMLTYGLCVLRPELLDFAFPLVGWLPPQLLPDAESSNTNRLPTIRTVHGTADPIIDVHLARGLVGGLAERRWKTELKEFANVGHFMTEEMHKTFEGWLEEAIRAQGGLGFSS